MMSMKKNAVRTPGRHSNVIENMVILERRLYHHTYLAAVSKPYRDRLPGEGSNDIVFGFPAVIFDEDVSST